MKTKNINKRNLKNRLANILFIIVTLFVISMLFVLLADVAKKGLPWLSKDFFLNLPSRFPSKSGLKPAIFGSLWIISLTAIISIPIGIGAAIYLEEYAKNTAFNRFIKVNISNLAGVPSIVYGMLGLTVFVRTLGFGRSILSGALTMALLILPIIIVSSQEAIKNVPESIKHASLALGATKWQTITKVTLPFATPGILTGIILSLSRALGETAPLLLVGAFTFISTLPKSPMDSFVAIPIQIYSWAGKPQEDFQNVAAAGILVLLALLLSTNALAIILRNKYQKSLD